ncbi:AMP-binding protein [Arthrobacter sp. JZ12]|uniref:AMP-binding protein n=1 Tax=Arthrobacter sp. JZ12 TaxID=2654190 RepID=UPI002B4820CE|nr:AMP-binding protein [Arthrobacter sp. JZ12]WRH24915.1 AMP-binding protein [Arthrobacter sp. JZ12]
MPFINRLLERARVTPDSDAVVTEEGKLTCAELVARASALPLPDGNLVALELADPLAFTVAFTAVVGRGKCAAVLDPAWPEELRTRVLDGLRPVGVLDELLFSGAVPEAAEADGRPGALADAAAETRFYCGFTSGTSGVPKAFVRSSGSWARSLRRSAAYFGVTPGLRTFAPGPLSSSLNLYALAEALYAGAAFFTLGASTQGPRGVRMAEALASWRIQHLVAVPAAVGLALQRVDSLPALRTVVAGGARLTDLQVSKVLRVAPNAWIFEYYGASELSLVTARRVHGAVGGAVGGDVGKPFPGVRLRIEADQPMSPGTIWVSTDTAIDGYLLGDDGHGFTRDGEWVTVHDQGWIDDDGGLHLAGRAGDMLVVAGTNVYPSEVEDALARIGFRSAVAFGIPDGRRGTLLAAAIEAESHEEVDSHRIRQALRETLPAVKIPSRVKAVDSIPLTAAGKPDRAALAVLMQDSEATRAHIS